MAEINITADKLRKANPTHLPDRAIDFSRAGFWQYTRLTTADLILSSSCFRVSNLNGMNDLDEARQHDTERNNIFSLCFCNSDTEKIPMWYLYSGLAGDGAALGFTPARMLSWLHSIKTVRATCAGQEKDKGDLLTVGKDIELLFGWVYYQTTTERSRIMYRNKWYNVDDISAFQKDNYFIKSYPWEYEKEFRIVFINHTRRAYEYLFVDIPAEIQAGIKVRLAPELRKDLFKKFTGLNCIGSTHIPSYSKLSIRMNLFNRNRVGLLDYLREEIAHDNPGIEIDNICNMIQAAKKCNIAKN